MEVPINYLAVIVSTIASMALGFVWYGPLFGKQWAGLMGWTKESMMDMNAHLKDRGLSMNKIYAIQAVGSLIMAFVLSHALVFASTYLHESGVSAGLQTGFWNWLGFVAPVTIGVVLWEGKPWKLWFLLSGYWLVNLLVMGVILALWM